MPKNNYSHISSAQLAKICQVSQGTVDRALNNREGISPATKEKILEAAKKYGFSPNIPDGKIQGTRSMLYAIVLLNLYNDYFSRFVMDFEQHCKEIGYNSIVMFSHNNPQTEIGCINQMVHLGVDGLILSPVGKTEDYCSWIQSLNLPIVTIANRLPGVPFVGLNDYLAMKGLTEHAIRQGYKNLIYYAPVLKKRMDENIYAQKERYNGFVAGAEALGVEHHLLTDEFSACWTPEQERTAVICPSDVYAIRILDTLYDQKQTDIGIFGFDNCDSLIKRHPSIDSVSYDRNELIEVIHAVLTSENPPEITYIPHRIVSR